MDDETKPKGQMSAEVRRELLMTAALEVMKREGVAAASTRAICEEAGMPHGAFHYCFGSKRELFAAILRNGLDVPLEKSWILLSPSTHPEDAFRILLRGYWDDVVADPRRELVLSELTNHALRDDALRGLPAWESGLYRERIAKHLSELAERTGSEVLIPHTDLAEMILSAILGATTSWLSHGEDETARRTLDHFAGVFARFIHPREATVAADL
ncbi:TetR/AcrR family transcriptional regulator [Rothia sp. AR01]|uniref:TetR/AcrR family transcriptional regulator n=1 Tax=Rothia santali TaxID=2949643 RepID=A0A9X2KHP2_9MICC|nr:TetR/AcrR family transcriptional regulator [Rothia santali]MCP3426052.1 TetR/AcrR family transcriptional regulator [Rothia santali]